MFSLRTLASAFHVNTGLHLASIQLAIANKLAGTGFIPVVVPSVMQLGATVQ